MKIQNQRYSALLLLQFQNCETHNHRLLFSHLSSH